MTDEQLRAVQARHEAALQATVLAATLRTGAQHVQRICESAADVPALLAEVRRLRACVSPPR